AAAFHEPVKTYSTGMRARLGFATAVTMRADVLLIDEVLGVGDAGFRKKAETEIMQRIKSGLTAVIVSHVPGQIKALCDRVIWLESGRIACMGSPDEVLERYAKALSPAVI